MKWDKNYLKRTIRYYANIYDHIDTDDAAQLPGSQRLDPCVLDHHRVRRPQRELDGGDHRRDADLPADGADHRHGPGHRDQRRGTAQAGRQECARDGAYLAGRIDPVLPAVSAGPDQSHRTRGPDESHHLRCPHRPVRRPGRHPGEQPQGARDDHRGRRHRDGPAMPSLSPWLLT